MNSFIYSLCCYININIRMNQQVSLDDAILNLEKINAQILLETDLKLKGVQIGHGWAQLKVIKEVV